MSGLEDDRSWRNPYSRGPLVMVRKEGSATAIGITTTTRKECGQVLGSDGQRTLSVEKAERSAVPALQERESYGLKKGSLSAGKDQRVQEVYRKNKPRLAFVWFWVWGGTVQFKKSKSNWSRDRGKGGESRSNHPLCGWKVKAPVRRSGASGRDPKRARPLLTPSARRGKKKPRLIAE